MEKIFNGASKKSGVYQIRNKLNGKVYIGSTAEFKRRATQHERSLRNKKHQNKHLQYAWNQYKEDAFIFEVLEVVKGKSTKKRRTIEEKYINEVFGQETCYNIRKGTIKTKGPWSSTPEETKEKIRQSRLGKRHTEETKKKLATAHMGRKHSGETRKKMSEAHKGKKHLHTEETKKKMSKTKKGKHYSPNTEFKKDHKTSEETRRKQSKANKGKKPYEMTEKTKRKISKARKGTHHSKETRKKLSNKIPWNKGKTLINEKTRKKMSEAHKGKKQSIETKRKRSKAMIKAWKKRKLNIV